VVLLAALAALTAAAAAGGAAGAAAVLGTVFGALVLRLAAECGSATASFIRAIRMCGERGLDKTSSYPGRAVPAEGGS
jgi:hypothetical protein